LQFDFEQDFAQVPQWFILLLQQGVLAKESVHIDNIIIVMKRNFFMILIFNLFNNK